MILKFDEFINISEGVEANLTYKDLKRILEPLGWSFEYRNPNLVISKDGCVAVGHLKHNAAQLEHRYVDWNQIGAIRKYIIKQFLETGDITELKSIPWERFVNTMRDPFTKELKNYDPETGLKKEADRELTDEEKEELENISNSNELYKDASLWKIDYNDDNSAYIINYNGKYNTCKSETDRRPLLTNWNPTDEDKDWTPYFKNNDGKVLFGKENWGSGKIEYREVLSDGSLKNNVVLKESKQF